jgi:hypothetical protein
MVFTLMDSTSVETMLEERRPEFLLMSSTKEQRENFRSLFYEDFPELLQPVNSLHVSR